ncbi:MAG: hypothetical protein ACUVQ0_00620 [Thermoproteota archaeon]
MVSTYVVEIHGSELPIVEYMKECGYSCKLIKRGGSMSIYLFTRGEI